MINDPRLKDLVRASPRSRLLKRIEEIGAQRRGIPIVWTAGGYRLKGLPSNVGEVPIVVLDGGRQVRRDWTPNSDADAIALWRWRSHVARAA